MSLKFFSRCSTLLASRSSPTRSCAPAEWGGRPSLRKMRCDWSRRADFAFFREPMMTAIQLYVYAVSAGRAGQRRLELAHARCETLAGTARCETLAGTHIAREDAVRRGHAGAIGRSERRIRAPGHRAQRRWAGNGSLARKTNDCCESGAARHLPVAARARRPARRAHTTQKARHARAAPRARRRSARARPENAIGGTTPGRRAEKKVRTLDARSRRARTRASRAEARARRARWKGVVTAGEAYLRRCRWCGRTHCVRGSDARSRSLESV